MMSWLCAAIVGVVLAIAGASKFTNWQGWLQSAKSQSVWKVVAYALPACELLLGAFLVVVPSSAAVLGLATLLLLIFTVFLAVRVASGATQPCACFGVRATRPPSWRDVMCNIALIALLFASAALR